MLYGLDILKTTKRVVRECAPMRAPGPAMMTITTTKTKTTKTGS